MPFLLGRAVILAVEKSIRFGKEILSYSDKYCAQVYQAVFMEISGFKVDQVFVVHWLKRHFIKDPTVDTAVLEFINNQADYLKEQAIQQYKQSQNPIEKLEYNLNKLIGPSKIKDRVQFCLDQ